MGTRAPGPILVVAAWKPELARLRGRAVTRVVGVGLVDAAVGAARALAELRPRAVILVGTAGRYPGARIRVGEAAVVRRVRLLSTAVVRAQAYFPGPLVHTVETSPALRRGFAAERVLDVACPLAITASSAAARLRPAGCALENLEAFAVARAADAAKVPFACVLGVANTVGPRAHAQWRANAAGAAASACDLVLARIKAPTRPSRRGGAGRRRGRG